MYMPLDLLVCSHCHGVSYGEVPYKMIATAEIQEKVREGTRLEQPAGFGFV